MVAAGMAGVGGPLPRWLFHSHVWHIIRWLKDPSAGTIDLSIYMLPLQYGGLKVVGLLTWWLRAPS